MEDLESEVYDDDANFTRTLTEAASLIRRNFVHLEISFRTLHVEYRVERASVSLEGFVGEYSSTGWRELQSAWRGLWVSTQAQGAESVSHPGGVCG